MKAQVLAGGLILIVGFVAGVAFGNWRSTSAERSATTFSPPAERSPRAAPPASNTGQAAAGSTAAPAPSGAVYLNLENPRFAKSLETRDKKLIEWFRGKHSEAYEKLFAEYGLAPELREDAFEHITKIYEAKIQLRKYTTQMMDAQAAYQDKMRTLLGDRYAAYAAYEKQWPVREEIEFVAEHANRQGTPLSPGKLDSLHRIIEEAGAFSWKSLGSLGGPTGNIPQVIYGSENTIPYWERQQAELAFQSTAVISQARASGFSEEEVSSLEAYYKAQLKYYDDAIEMADLASPKKIAQLQQKIADLSTTQVPDRQQIARMKEKLAWMQEEAAKKAAKSP